MVPKQTSRRGFSIFCAMLLLCVALAVYSVSSDTVLASDHIAVLDIVGTISENDGYTYDQQYLLNSVEEIKADSHNQGLILHIDSPGGNVYQIDELYLKLMEYKEETGRPVYAAIESYAASGGYYEACAADAIYANRNAITGSIGVIMGGFMDYSGLLEKLGVDVTYITSGENKAMGRFDEPMTEEQKAIYQAICDESFGQFIDVVVAGRGMDEATVRELADGRVYTARQALEHGLIDGLEPFEDTVARMTADLGYDDIEVQTYSYRAPAGLLDYLSSSSVFDSVTALLQQNSTSQAPQQSYPIWMYHSF